MKVEIVGEIELSDRQLDVIAQTFIEEFKAIDEKKEGGGNSGSEIDACCG